MTYVYTDIHSQYTLTVLGRYSLLLSAFTLVTCSYLKWNCRDDNLSLKNAGLLSVHTKARQGRNIFVEEIPK